MHFPDFTKRNNRQKVIMFVPVTKASDGPKVEMRVFARLDIVQNLGGKFWKGSLYRRVGSGCFKVSNFLGERKVTPAPRSGAPFNGVVPPIVEGFPQIVDRITYRCAEMFINRLFGAIGELVAIRIS